MSGKLINLMKSKAFHLVINLGIKFCQLNFFKLKSYKTKLLNRVLNVLKID